MSPNRQRTRAIAAALIVAAALLTTSATIPRDAAASHAADSCHGPHDKVDVVQAHDTDVYRICFRAGQASIRVDGDNDTDLDCFVRNVASGVEVARDDDATDYCVLDWNARGGTYRLEIRNLGRRWNEYRLTTN